MRILKNLFTTETKFVLISTQRSGTTLLAEYLNSHPDIDMGYELFKMESEGYNVDKERGYRNFSGSICSYLDDYYAAGLKNKKACGFKVMLNQLSASPEIMAYFESNKIQCIYLERENIFDAVISRLTARERDLHHIQHSTKLDLVSINTNLLFKELGTLEMDLVVLKQLVLKLKHINIYYNELVKNKESTIKKILSFLNVESSIQVKAKVQKINDDELNNILTNYDEVYNAIYNSKYRNYLPLRTDNEFDELIDIYKTIFIHVPKVAGSSIEKVLYDTKGEVTHRIALDYLKKDKIKFDGYFKFAFVRNPYDRFISAYEYLKVGGRNKYDLAWAEKHILPYATFKDFVLSLNNQDRRENVCSWMHFKPQYFFVCDENKNIIVDFIGKYENLSADFNIVTNKLKVDIELPYENKTKERECYKSYFDKETREIIENIYKDDFILFEYGKLS